MSFLEFDYSVIRACLNHERYAWEDFVDRFMDLTIHVVEHTASRCGKRVDDKEKTELCEAIFRRFVTTTTSCCANFPFKRGLDVPLTVVARRIAVALITEINARKIPFVAPCIKQRRMNYRNNDARFSNQLRRTTETAFSGCRDARFRAQRDVFFAANLTRALRSQRK